MSITTHLLFFVSKLLCWCMKLPEPLSEPGGFFAAPNFAASSALNFVVSAFSLRYLAGWVDTCRRGCNCAALAAADRKVRTPCAIHFISERKPFLFVHAYNGSKSRNLQQTTLMKKKSFLNELEKKLLSTRMSLKGAGT